MDWKKWITVDKMALNNHLILEIENEEENNLFYRFFTIQLNDKSIDEDSLINYIKEQTIKFIFTEKDIREFQDDGIEPLNEALAKFGDVDPIRDGKYGELLLYILTEAILESPMVVQKLSFTYPNNQAHGADGIFIGDYKGNPSLFIGESKMQQKFSDCLTNALASIERFHTDEQFLKQELLISRKQLRDDLNGTDLDFIYQSLKHGSDEFSSNSIVHPILLMYNENKFQEIINDSASQVLLKQSLLDLITGKLEKRIQYITSKSLDVRKNEKVFLDFFLIPVHDMTEFREKCYQAFHNGKRFQRT